jgi:hypothetical protein
MLAAFNSSAERYRQYTTGRNFPDLVLEEVGASNKQQIHSLPFASQERKQTSLFDRRFRQERENGKLLAEGSTL